MRNFFDSPADRQLELNDASATSAPPGPTAASTTTAPTTLLRP
jgi:hypothetical protein